MTDKNQAMIKKLPDNQLVFFQSQDGLIHVEVMYAEENIRLSQKKMAELFGVDISTITEHVQNIYKQGELQEEWTCGKFPIVQKEWEREIKRQIKFYSLEVIIATGYRVNSDRGREFRSWATQILKNYIHKWYVLDSDRISYFLMKAWKENENIDFDFYNAHDINNLRQDSSEETIKKKLRERLNNSKIFVVLIWKNTKNLYKYVRWEMEIALDLDLSIVCVNLNWKRQIDNDLCPTILKDKLTLHVSFSPKIIKKALNDWWDVYTKYKREDKINQYHYTDVVYSQIN